MLDKIFKALAPLTDKFRYAYVNVRADGTIEATNGAAAIVVRGVTHGLAPGQYDPKASLARIKAGVAPEPVAGADDFPNVDRAIPAQTDDGSGEVFGLDALLMVKVMDALAAIGKANGCTALAVYRVQPGGPKGATLLTADFGTVNVACAVMPCRI
jgi:hypothetical protein